MSPIGLRVAGSGRLIKGRLTGGDYLVFRYLSGFKTEQLAVPARELEEYALEPAHAQA